MRRLIILCLAAGVLFICGCKKGDEDFDGKSVITLSYANFAPPTSFATIQMNRFGEELEKRSNGKVRIDSKNVNLIAQELDIIDGVVMGNVDIGCLPLSAHPGRFAIINVAGLPLGIGDAVVGTKLLNAIYEKYKPAGFGGVKLIALFSSSPSNIMSKRALRNLDELKGINIGATGLAASVLSTWGANVADLKDEQIPNALKMREIEAALSSTELMQDLEFALYCKYITQIEATVCPYAVVMNKEKWEKLPKDVKELLEELIKEHSLWTANYLKKHTEEAIQWAIEKHIVNVIELSSEQKARLNELLSSMIDKWVIDQSARGVPAEQILRDARNWVSQYSKEQ